MYKTAEEIIQSGVGKKKSMPSKASKVKVIDMTGKEKRVLSGNVKADTIWYIYVENKIMLHFFIMMFQNMVG